MTRIRQWSLGTTALFVLILVASWFLLVSPKKSEATDIQTQTQTQLEQNDQLRSKLVTLQQQSTKLADQQARLAAIRQHLPATLALATFIRTTSAAATGANVTLDSLAPSEPAPVTPATPVGQPAVTTPSTGLMVVRVDVKSTGSYYDIERFLNKLESQQRSFLVTGFSITSGGGASAGAQTVSITLQGRIYYAPQFTAPTATAATPAPVPTAATS